MSSSTERTSTISTNGLTIGYKRRGAQVSVVHSGLDLELYPGEVTCLMGLNGAGKSTLLRTLSGLQKPLDGKVMVMGRPLDSFSKSELSTTVGVVLTEHTNAGGMTVRDLVSLGRYPHTGFFGTLGEDDLHIVEEALTAVGIAHKADCHASELSDGERQKAFIAKVLAQECPVMILDEPSAFLDVVSRMEIMVLLRRLAREQGKSVLLSTHDLELALRMADRLWLMGQAGGYASDAGSGSTCGSASAAFCCGTPSELSANGSLEAFFSRDGIRFDAASGRLVSDK